MSNERTTAIPGKTRVCPHCKAVILDSASICPGCQHHLRFEQATERRSLRRFSPLTVEGTFRHSTDEAPWEYSVVISIRNDQGQEIKRHVVDVGAMQPDEQRSFSLAVEMTVPRSSETRNC